MIKTIFTTLIISLTINVFAQNSNITSVSRAMRPYAQHKIRGNSFWMSLVIFSFCDPWKTGKFMMES
jgi:hypothetical protein